MKVILMYLNIYLFLVQPLLCLINLDVSSSITVRTRKMVNYA